MRRKLLIGCFSFFGIAILAIALFIGVSLYGIYQTYRSPEELADPDGQFADVDGVRIYYVAKGDKSHPALMLIHGFGGSTFTWRDNMDVLADAGYYVVAMDLPPFGLSDKSPIIGYSRSDFAAYIAGLMDELEISSASLVGHSMGGTVIAHFVVNYPERVDRLVFVDGGIFAENIQRNREEESPLGFLNEIDPASPITGDILRLSLRPSTFAEIMSSAYYDPAFITEEVVAGYARPLQLSDWPAGFLAFLQSEESQSISVGDLAEVATMPCLIIWGENDNWIAIENSEAMLASLQDVQFIQYPEVGHLPMEENVDAFNRDLAAFLAD